MNKKRIIIILFILFAFFTFIYYNKYVNKLNMSQLSWEERELLKSHEQYLSESFISTKYSTWGNVIIKEK